MSKTNTVSREDFLIEMGRAFEFFSYNFTEVFERFFRIAKKITVFDSCFGLIVDDATSEVMIPYVENLDINISKIEINSREDLHKIWSKSVPGFAISISKKEEIPLIFASNPKLKSFILIPLITGNQLIGVIGFASMNKNHFPEDQMDYFFSLADQLAVAARHVMMHIGAKDHIDRLNELLHLEMKMDSSKGITHFLSDLASNIRREFELSGISIFFKNNNNDRFFPQYTAGLHKIEQTDTSFSLEDLPGDITGNLRDKHQYVLFKNEIPETIIKSFRLPRSSNSVMILPLLHLENLYGILALGSINKNYFSPVRANFLSLLASYAAVSIRNAMLYNELKTMLLDVKKSRDQAESYSKQLRSAHRHLEKRYQELSNLYEIGKTINAHVELKDVLDLILAKSTSLVEADKACIMLYDPDEDALKIHSAIGMDEETMMNISFHPGEGIAGTVFVNGRSKLVQSIIEETKFLRTHKQLLADESLMAVPLSIEGECIGILNVDKMNINGAFTLDDLEKVEAFAGQASIALHKARLFEDIHELYEDTLIALTSAIDQKDSYTHGHSNRVAGLAVEVARKMNLPKEEINVIFRAAQLHDFGKVLTEKNILSKTSKLNPEEAKKMHEHPVAGSDILRKIKRFEKEAIYVRHHHEYYDGSGYPDGLSGEDIPLGARIILVADTYDAMTTDRPYRKALKHDMALKEIKRLAGKQFDPMVVGAFLSLIESQPHNISMYRNFKVCQTY